MYSLSAKGHLYDFINMIMWYSAVIQALARLPYTKKGHGFSWAFLVSTLCWRVCFTFSNAWLAASKKQMFFSIVEEWWWRCELIFLKKPPKICFLSRFERLGSKRAITWQQQHLKDKRLLLVIKQKRWRIIDSIFKCLWTAHSGFTLIFSCGFLNLPIFLQKYIYYSL